MKSTRTGTTHPEFVKTGTYGRQRFEFPADGYNDCGAGSEQVNVMPLKMSGQLRSGELRGHFCTRALDEKTMPHRKIEESPQYMTVIGHPILVLVTKLVDVAQIK